ncbi:hypothetical protein AnigIFM50267_005218 [Aspergillus niger]|nr:hypothetical protein AnigIFM50267_005218 [Aspergillus niger]
MTTLTHSSPNLRPAQSPSLYNGLSSTTGVPMAAWTGISGDKWYGFDKAGPEPIKISKEWIKDHIQIGPLGSVYPAGLSFRPRTISLWAAAAALKQMRLDRHCSR